MIKKNRDFSIGQLILNVAITVLSLTYTIDASADTFWIQGNNQPIYGKFLSEDDQFLLIKETKDGNVFEERKILREKVQVSIINFDQAKLGALSPKNYSAYRDLAEELSSQSSDPVARMLAIRLFIVVAANCGDGERELQTSALAGLSRLAQTDDEKTRWQTLRYLFDKNAGESLPAKPAVEGPDKLTQEKMLDLVQSLRKGEPLSEIDDKVVAHWSETLSKKELIEISRANRTSPDQFRKLLQIEFQIRNPNPNVQNESETRWGPLATSRSQANNRIPSLENATPFDPRKSIFRDGKWIAPAN